MFFGLDIALWRLAAALAEPRAAADYAFVRRLQQTFFEIGFDERYDKVLLIIGAIAALVLFLLVLKRVLRPNRSFLADPNIDRIVQPRQIHGLIRRSIDTRAMYDLEVYDPAYQQIYKCSPLGLNRDGQIEVDLGGFTNPNLDFAGKRVRVAFRLARRGKQEFYNFETRSLYLDRTTIRGYQEKAIRLEMPKVLTLGQKRRFVRVEPRGAFSFELNIVRPTSAQEQIPLKEMKLVAKAAVEDISVGGVKAVLVPQTAAPDLKPNDLLYLHFQLPARELGLENVPKNFFLAARVVSCEDSPSREKRLRRMFVERGALDVPSRAVSFKAATWMSFEDLARWIQAYQRRQLKEARDTASKPETLFSIYAAPMAEAAPRQPQEPPQRPPDRTEPEND